MKHKVIWLEGVLLDLAVVKAEAAEEYRVIDGRCCVPCYAIGGGWMPFEPSQDWLIGGPIIEREQITLQPTVDDEWQAHTVSGPWSDGKTPLISAMRAYVASKFGEEVELP